MNAKPIALLTGLLLPICVLAQDPVQTDGDKYKVLLENDQVRVLEYTDQPGQKTQRHRHPAFVVYAPAPFRRTLTLADGRVVSREFRAGDVMFSNGETHIGENAGSSATRVLTRKRTAARSFLAPPRGGGRREAAALGALMIELKGARP